MFCLVSEKFGSKKAGWRPFRGRSYISLIYWPISNFSSSKCLQSKIKGGYLTPISAKRSNRGCYKTKAVSRPELYLPYLLTDFKCFKLKMLAIKNKGGYLKPIWARRSNRGCYKTEAVSRPELYLPYLLTDFKIFKLKMLVIKNKGALPKADLS